MVRPTLGDQRLDAQFPQRPASLGFGIGASLGNPFSGRLQGALPGCLIGGT